MCGGGAGRDGDENGAVCKSTRDWREGVGPTVRSSPYVRIGMHP